MSKQLVHATVDFCSCKSSITKLSSSITSWRRPKLCSTLPYLHLYFLHHELSQSHTPTTHSHTRLLPRPPKFHDFVLSFRKRLHWSKGALQRFQRPSKSALSGSGRPRLECARLRICFSHQIPIDGNVIPLSFLSPDLPIALTALFIPTWGLMHPYWI